MGRNRIHKLVDVNCKNCGVAFAVNENRIDYRKTCSFKCLGEMKSKLSGEQTNGWKGGSFVDEAGYKLIRVAKTGKKYKREHHLVMEEHIGRELKKTEIVHHWDSDRMNNKLENLALMRSTSAHMRLHGFAKRHGFDVSLLKFEQPWLTQTA